MEDYESRILQKNKGMKNLMEQISKGMSPSQIRQTNIELGESDTSPTNGDNKTSLNYTKRRGEDKINTQIFGKDGIPASIYENSERFEESQPRDFYSRSDSDHAHKLEDVRVHHRDPFYVEQSHQSLTDRVSLSGIGPDPTNQAKNGTSYQKEDTPAMDVQTVDRARRIQ